MADVPSIPAKFWSSEGMSSKHDSLVPGVNDVGNQRPKPKVKVKGGKTKEVKAAVPVNQPLIVETTDTHGKTTMSSGLLSTDISTLGTDISNLQARGVTLKDLCAEDKKRIANLIKELAKVGEEKENAEHNLTEERNHYQQQILTLVQQQEAILKEREDVQNRLLEYQSYIVKLQQQQQLQQLLQHQKKNRHSKQQQQQQQQQEDQPKQQEQHHSRVKDNLNEAVKNSGGVYPQRQQPKRRQSKQRPQSQDDDLEDKNDQRIRRNAGHAVISSGPRDTQCNWHEDERSLERDEDFAMEEPSTHIYINETNATATDQSDPLDGLSTYVLPSQSPPPQPVIDSSSSRPLPHRPFTAMIDKQLTKERRKVEEVVENVKMKTNHDNDREEGVGLRYTEDLRTGAPVSPEKAELFSRFMGVQSRPHRADGIAVNNKNHNDDDDHFNREKQMELKRREKGRIADERRSVDVAKDTKKTERHHQYHNKPSKTHQHRHPPTKSLGGFYPPIMSSTQKSSEIGDYVSNADSTLVSNMERDVERFKGVDDDGVGDDDDDDVDVDVGARKGKTIQMASQDVDRNDAHAGFIHGKKEKAKPIKTKDGGGESWSVNMRGRDNNNDDDDDNGDAASGRRMANARLVAGGVGVDEDDYDSDFKNLMETQLGADKDFLHYYKKLSASERKRELLNQRAALLEEQNKLRHLLTKHEQHNYKRQQFLGNIQETETRSRNFEKNGLEKGEKEEEFHSPDPMSDVVVSGHGLKKGRAVSSVNRKGHNSASHRDDRQSVSAAVAVARNKRDGQELKIGGGSGRKGGARENDGEGQGHRLRGRDGDECVTYDKNDNRMGAGGGGGVDGMDAVVKRLEYSFLSNTEEEVTSPTSNLDKKFIVTPDNNQNNNNDDDATPASDSGHLHHPKESIAMTTTTTTTTTTATDLKNAAVVSSPTPATVDAGTSMSFSSSIPSDVLLVEKPETLNKVKDTRHSSHKKTPSHQSVSRPRFSESPGDKTLAVLKIINSLPGENENDDDDKDGNSHRFRTALTKERVTQSLPPQPYHLPKTFTNNSKTHQHSKPSHNNNSFPDDWNNGLDLKLKPKADGRSDQNYNQRQITSTSTSKTRKSLFREGRKAVRNSDGDDEDDFGINENRWSSELRVQGSTLKPSSTLRGEGRSRWVGGLRPGDRNRNRKPGHFSGLGNKDKNSNRETLLRRSKTGGKGLRVDEELEVFDCVGLKEERLNGLRKIVSGGGGGNGDDDDGVDDDDDETFYDYDDNDDSNLDDLLSGGEEFVDDDDDNDDGYNKYNNDVRGVRGSRRLTEYDDGEDEGKMWDSVIKSLNPIPNTKSKARMKYNNVNLIDDNDVDTDDDDLKVVKVDYDDDGGDVDDEDSDSHHGSYLHLQTDDLSDEVLPSRRKKDKLDVEDSEESAILEDVFFVNY